MEIPHDVPLSCPCYRTTSLGSVPAEGANLRPTVGPLVGADQLGEDPLQDGDVVVGHELRRADDAGDDRTGMQPDTNSPATMRGARARVPSPLPGSDPIAYASLTREA